MNVQVSTVFSHGDKFRLTAKCNDKQKGYEFAEKREAVKARARLIKRLKSDGFKVYL